MRIKKGDQVKVISGKNKGKIGKVLRVIPGTNRVLVEGVNLIYRHSRPTQRNPKGGIVEKEAPIDASNVMLFDTRSNKPTRVNYRVLEDPDKKAKNKVRISNKSGEIV
ncbi:MAG: 50S ribosomal protein L24 [candidate division Zixibacteria bacterium]|nr:50S ribosomal protein L24 [candidate division Zixibacteria bacterium]